MTRIWVADTEPSERYPLYTRGNTGEVFPNVMTALTGTLVGDEVARGQLEIFLELGFLTKRDVESTHTGTGVFAGYLYGSGSLMRLFGVRSPGMKATTGDEQVFGTIDGVPPYIRSKGDRNLLSTLRVSRFLVGVLRRPDLAPLDQDRSAAQAWLATMPPLATAGDDELLTFLATYPRRIGDSMKRLLYWSIIAAGPRVLVDRAVEATKAAPGLANRLVSGIDDVDSALLARHQWALARIVAGDADLTAMFDAGIDGLAGRLTGTALEAPLAEFLERFGHRGNDEYELATPSWSMDPRPVLASIDRLRHAPAEHDPELILQRLAADRARAEEELSRVVRPPKRGLARRAAEVSRLGSIGRERAKDILVLENLGARQVLYELARRAAERGGPPDLRRTFCVTADELAAFVADPAAFADVIDERAAQETYLNERVPPLWFESRIPDPRTWPLRADAGRSVPEPGSTITGIAVSSGRAAGRARVVTDPGDPRGLEPGEVLVCPITDPAWTPLFLVASAVVCETGAMQSHAAIVARELGIPGVLSARGITGVADGTWLEVDGDLGTVRVGDRFTPPRFA